MRPLPEGPRRIAAALAVAVAVASLPALHAHLAAAGAGDVALAASDHSTDFAPARSCALCPAFSQARTAPATARPRAPAPPSPVRRLARALEQGPVRSERAAPSPARAPPLPA